MNIQIPTLLLDENKCRQNINTMAEKANKSKVTFRPHFKTHQSAEIGRWFAESGVKCITVSSVQMAEYFAKDGWDDILIAFPVNILEIEKINSLAQKIKLYLLVESTEVIEFLNNHLKFQCGVYIKIDTGYKRTGLSPDNTKVIGDIFSHIKKSKKLIFSGILTHAGHSYDAHKIDEILNIHTQSIQKLKDVKEMALTHFSNCILSVGDTPTCSLASDFKYINEIRPGNFVFYDIMQCSLYSCNSDQIAVALACPIVAMHRSRNEVVIYGGAVHLSKESISYSNHQKIFGLIVKINENSWGKSLEGTYLSSVSQEHGIIKTTEENFDLFRVGGIAGILPVHSCLTANLMGYYTTLDNKKIEKFRFIS